MHGVSNPLGKSTEILQTNESFNKSEIKTTEVGDGDGKWKPHVLRGKNPWKGTDISVVQCEKNLLNSNTTC